MCTVTVIPRAGEGGWGLRIGCNRDESPLRPAARPPQVQRFGARAALLPIDPASGGTWIAVNDAGLAFVLLNRNPAPGQGRSSALSRGSIIPGLLGCTTLAEARSAADYLAGQAFAPFRLLLVGPADLVDITFDAAGMKAAETPLAAPLLFTSSGLGDALVDAPRRELFNGWFAHATDTAAQDRFHRHSWPERRHLSVCMARPEARTVSYTVIERWPGAATMSYWPRPPDEPGEAIESGLSLIACGAVQCHGDENTAGQSCP